MKKYLFLILCNSFFICSTFSQVQQLWYRTYDAGINKYCYSTNMDFDSTGSIYITGRGVTSIAAKYSNTGQLLWKDTVSGAQPIFETKYSVLSKSGKLFVVGLGYITPTQGALFLIKYNSNGNRLWVKTYYDSTTPTPDAFTVDDEENIYIAGTISISGHNIGFAKYDSSGNFILSRFYYNPLYYWYNYGTGITMDGLRNLYVVGYVNVDPPNAHYNSVITKYDYSGNQIWTRIFSDTSQSFTNQPVRVVCDKQNNVVIGLNSNYGIYLWNIIVLKYSDSGNFIWRQSYSGTTNYNTLRELRIDNKSDIYLSAAVASNSTGTYDCGTIKYDSSGSKLWENRYSYPVAQDNTPNYMFLDSAGNSYTTGGLTSIKLDSRGNNIWTILDTTVTNGAYFLGKVIKRDNQNNVILLGDVSDIGATPRDFIIIKKYSQLVGIVNQNHNIENYKLYQNFPNPFNPATNIKYQISYNSNVTLRVYDILGKEITTLVNEKRNPGNYEVKFDAGNLSSGIYFYSLIINGNIIDTKKFMLLK